jgi:uncharacterized protein (DUF1499 family)
MTAQAVRLDNFFDTLKRPGSPNNWLVAPADFAIAPDAVAPVFNVPMCDLIDTFKVVALRSKDVAVVEESAHAVHVIATTPLLRFKDDVWVRFIPMGENASTVALYSASRVGYWDLGTNRRRLKDWIGRVQNALAPYGQ